MIAIEIDKYFTDKVDDIEKQYDAADQRHNLRFMDDAIRNITGNNYQALDLGAGQGHYADRLAERYNFEVVAAEPVAAMIEKGRAKFPDLRICWAQAALPDLSEGMKDMQFSFMAALGSWHYLEDQEQRTRSLKTLKGVLAPGGRFVTIHPYPTSRPGQQTVSHNMMVDEIEGSGWKIERSEKLPYPVSGNKEVTNDVGLLAYELSFDPFAH